MDARAEPIEMFRKETLYPVGWLALRQLGFEREPYLEDLSGINDLMIRFFYVRIGLESRLL
jgi:hypothetical protein